jgi:hypothetical protein
MDRRTSPARAATRFAPKLEALADRVVPAVTPVLDGTTLILKGDSRANEVLIEDDGTTLTVTADGETVDVADTVEKIVISLGSGDDTVTYDLTGDLTVARAFEVSLGNGKDEFTGSVEGNLLDGSSLDVVARGMNGRDSLSFDAAGDIAADASLSVALGGGNGVDAVGITFGGTLLGDLSLSGSGGNGKDTVSADATFDSTGVDGTTGDPLAGGNADVEVLGGNGPDRLTLTVADSSGDDGDPLTTDDPETTLASLTAKADGGLGPDSADVSGDVEVVGAKTA